MYVYHIIHLLVSNLWVKYHWGKASKAEFDGPYAGYVQTTRCEPGLVQCRVILAITII
jgi:hypothetical protein